MLNESQVKLLRTLNLLAERWTEGNPDESLEMEMEAFNEDTGIAPRFHPRSDYRTGYYSISSEDLERVGNIPARRVPE